MRTCRFVVSGLIVLLLPLMLHGDDRDLLGQDGAPANVLLILDSGAQMVHDAQSDSICFPACGDDDGGSSGEVISRYGSTFLESRLGSDFRELLRQGSKLHQAKMAIRSFLSADLGLNLGFSFSERASVSISYLNYIYRVKTMIDTDGDGVDDTPQPGMLDGTRPGTVLRFGEALNVHGSSRPRPFYPIRYGRDASDLYIEDCDPLGRNRAYREGGDEPKNGDIRLVSALVDPLRLDPETRRPRRLASLSGAQRSRDHMWYYPAFDYSKLPQGQGIRAGLAGTRSWKEVAAQHGIDTTDEHWVEKLHDWVVPEIWSHQIGSEELDIEEFYEIYGRGGWRRDIGRPSRLTVVEFVQPFVLYDHPSQESMPADGSLSSVDYEDSSDCEGYFNQGQSGVPIVPFSEPDALDGSTEDRRSLIDAYLDPQWTPIFYFPTHRENFLPRARENYIPMTETIAAFGRRSIRKTIEEASSYIRETVGSWNDPLGACRRNILILVTDGEENCSENTELCSEAAGFPGAVYAIYLGSEKNVMNPDMSELSCLARRTGGEYFVAGDEEQLRAALFSVGRHLEEGDRSFAAPVFSPLDGANGQHACLATFRPRRNRSIWEGHLSAYPVDPETGRLAGMSAEGAPDFSAALWDAGDTLAARWDWGDVLTDNPWGSSRDPRRIYYGEHEGGKATRRFFAYPGEDAVSFERRAELGRAIFGSWAPDFRLEFPEERLDLHHVIDFIRGVRYGSDEKGSRIPLRDVRLDAGGHEIQSSSYHWCGGTGPGCAPGAMVQGIEKLGDIFHSTPREMGAPDCFACFEANCGGYRDFFETHRHRRRVIFAGSNDGAMHAFDGGLWDPDGEGDEPAQYDAGTGRELFAWVPQAVMGKFPAFLRGSSQNWTVDGAAALADVYIHRDSREVGAAAGREWRSFLLFGERRGGRSYVALDVTQPDRLQDAGPTPHGEIAFETRARFRRAPGSGGSFPVATWKAPSAKGLDQGPARDASCASGGMGCDGVWPEFRWEFTDLSDEDGNLEPDLGQTWSRPLVGFVRTGNGQSTEDRMLMFFGGGFSPMGVRVPPAQETGNFIYGLDVETGKILLKERVEGMVPGDVQGLDLDLDGFLEKIYFATTQGRIYRVDLSVPGRVSQSGRVSNWNPEKIFEAEGYQPFFMRPTLVPVSFGVDGRAVMAICIGAGNRDEIFEKNREPHRFYAFKEPPEGVVLSDLDLQAVGAGSAAVGPSLSYLAPGEGKWGWYLEFDEGPPSEKTEKVVTPALVLRSHIVFSTFNPKAGVDVVPVHDSAGGVVGYDCRRSGSARTYVLNLFNGDPRLGKQRFEELGETAEMPTEPVIYWGVDGDIHLVQTTDHLEMKEPAVPIEVPVAIVDWKEN